MTDIHPDTRVLLNGQALDPDDLEFVAYQKTKPADAVQMHVPFQVETLEGVFDAKAGDYLMRGPAGELYSCDKTIFEDTYAPYGDILDSATGVINLNEGPFRSDEFMWCLWVVIALAAFICVTALIWHTVDRHTQGYVEKQRTQQQISREWEQANASCARDEQPRICIERAHGNGAVQQ